MNDLETTYFTWLTHQLDPEGVTDGVAYLCELLHNCDFMRRVGRDINRAADGADLRKEFFEEVGTSQFHPDDVDDLLSRECSWLEMLIALSRALDYLYEGGVDGRFAELITNMKLGSVTVFNAARSERTRQYDQRRVEIVTSNIDNNRFDRDGNGGLFPLKKTGHSDQRGVEIWDQHAAYFRERLRGVLWTSTN